MPWAKLDDGFWSNPKIVQAGNEASGAYARCISYCAGHLTDGFIPQESMQFIAKSAVRKRMVSAGLLEEMDDGFWIPDYLDFNPEAEKVEAERSAARQRMQQRRAKMKAGKVR